MSQISEGRAVRNHPIVLFLTLMLALAALVTGCSGSPTPAAPADKAVVTISPSELLTRLQKGETPLLIDVREPQEYADGHITGAKLIPLGTVEKGITGTPKGQEIILICRSGNRSEQAYVKLAAMGYTNLKNMTGGMNQWEQIGAPIER